MLLHEIDPEILDLTDGWPFGLKEFVYLQLQFGLGRFLPYIFLRARKRHEVMCVGKFMGSWHHRALNLGYLSRQCLIPEQRTHANDGIEKS